MSRILTILAVFGLVSATAISAEATPRTRTEYVVTETHPATKGVISRRRFANRADAARQHDSLKAVHWVQWRFMGVNEPMRYQRFKSAGEAQAFINSDGPSKSGKFGIGLLTNETKLLSARVSLTAVQVPVTGGENGGNGNAGEVIDTIDRIIGIIGR